MHRKGEELFLSKEKIMKTLNLKSIIKPTGVILLGFVLLLVVSCGRSSTPQPREYKEVETETSTLFDSNDLSAARVVSQGSIKDISGIELNNDESGTELPFDDKDEVKSELSTQETLSESKGWLVLNRKDDSGTYQIRLHDQTNNNNRTTVYSGTDAVQSVAVNGDGKIVLASIVNHKSGKYDIYLFDLNNNQGYNLSNTPNIDELDVSITRDASKIAWQGEHNGKKRPFICNYDASEHSCTSTNSLSNKYDQIQPSLSANGDYLALVRLLKGTHYQVRLYGFENNSYINIETRTDVLSDPSVDEIGNQVMFLWQRSSNNRNYVRIKSLDNNTYETELSSSVSIDHPFITADAKYLTYEEFISSKSRQHVRTRNIQSNAQVFPQSGTTWDYRQPFWMLPMRPSCGMGTTITGHQVLHTQADVDALEGVSTITGGLYIDPTSTSLDLSPLYLLTEVTSDFGIENNSIQTTLSGFECLTRIGHYFYIAENNNLSSISGFPSLATVGIDFSIYNNDNLSSISGFPSLATVGGSSDYEGFRINDNDSLSSISGFPLLATVDSFDIGNNASLSSIPDFPALVRVDGGFSFYNNASLNSIPDFPALVRVEGGFSFYSNASLNSISGFPLLASAGHFGIGSNPSLRTIFGFPLLASVPGEFRIVNNANLRSIIGLNQLTAANIGSGISPPVFIISNNAQLDCSNPAPNFIPVDSSTGNLVNCVTNIYTSSPNIAIPDNNSTGISNTINITEVGTIADLNVRLNITHTAVGNLNVKLRHTDGFNITEVELVNHPGIPAVGLFGCSGDDMDNIALDDEALPKDSIQDDCMEDPNPAYTANSYYLPKDSLTAFDSQNLSGTWTLKVSDKLFGATGTLDSWSLEFAKQ